MGWNGDDSWEPSEKPMEVEAWDAIAIGAGAAGLMAAIHAAERGKRVLLLEKNRKPGVKILMSGGTRCNITHDCDNRGIVAAYGTQGKFLYSALAALSVTSSSNFPVASLLRAGSGLLRNPDEEFPITRSY